jgi:hypothetical protein
MSLPRIALLVFIVIVELVADTSPAEPTPPTVPARFPETVDPDSVTASELLMPPTEGPATEAAELSLTVEFVTLAPPVTPPTAEPDEPVAVF